MTVLLTLSVQFTANSPQEAREWVDQILFVLRGEPFCVFALFSCLCSMPCVLEKQIDLLNSRKALKDLKI